MVLMYPTLRWDSPVLVVVGGLPATGKTTVSRMLAREVAGTYLRVDSVEQSIRAFGSSGGFGASLRGAVEMGLGYEVLYRVAGDSLAEGAHVVAECVNPMKLTRDAWLCVAKTSGAQLVEVELVCSDLVEHQRRVEHRETDIDGLVLPTWTDVVNREYELWERSHIVLDTAGVSVDESIAELRRQLRLGGA